MATYDQSKLAELNPNKPEALLDGARAAALALYPDNGRDRGKLRALFVLLLVHARVGMIGSGLWNLAEVGAYLQGAETKVSAAPVAERQLISRQVGAVVEAVRVLTTYGTGGALDITDDELEALANPFAPR